MVASSPGARDTLFDIQRQVAELRGELAASMPAIMRELTQLGVKIDQHIEDDRRIHGQQDDRFLRELRKISERVAIIENTAALSTGANAAEQQERDRKHDRSVAWTAAGIAAGAAILASIVLVALEHWLR